MSSARFGRLFVAPWEKWQQDDDRGRFQVFYAAWRRLSPRGARAGVFARLPAFAGISATRLELLASKATVVAGQAQTVLVRQGDVGDRFYVVAEGEADVVVDGELVGTLGAGSGFGEIALLRDIPRTATVSARSDVLLYVLEREEFLSCSL
jgi:CRP-like cAMP-binding protein